MKINITTKDLLDQAPRIVKYGFDKGLLRHMHPDELAHRQRHPAIERIPCWRRNAFNELYETPDWEGVTR